MSIRLKLTFAILGCMLVLAGLTVWRVDVASRSTARLASEQALAAASRGLEGLERSDVEKLRTALGLLQAQPGLAAAFQAGDREKFLALAAPIFEDLRRHHDITHFYVHGLDRRNWVRVHRPAQFGEEVKRVTLARAAETGEVGAGKELGQNGFALRVVEPWKVDGAVIGYLELGEEIEHFLGRMRAQTGDDYSLLLLKERLDEKAWTAFYKERRPWGGDAEHVVANDTREDPQVTAGLRVAGLTGDQLLADVSRGGRSWARGLQPIRDASGKLAGGLVVLHDVTDLHANMAHTRNVLLGILLAVALGMALVLLGLTTSLVFARIDRMTKGMEDVGARLVGGDYEAKAPPRSGPEDEIGRFEDFFGRFVQVVSGIIRDQAAGAK
jgi:HAMP domain-containing protein